MFIYLFFSGLKNIVHVNLLGCCIVLLTVFPAFCPAAPTKQIVDETVLSWLRYWNQQLGESVWETFNTYVSYSRRIKFD